MDAKHILVVDNDEFYLEFLSDILQEEGYIVKKASDPIQGIQMAKSESFYCIFLDMIMPKIDGVKFLKCIREDPNLKDVPVVMVSAALIDEAANLDTLGADFYLYKGPAEKIKQNIHEILKKLGEEDRGRGKGSHVLGIKDMYRRAVVEELMSYKRHREVVLENMGEAVIETDSDLRITYINATGMKIFNKTEGQILGMFLCDLFKAESLIKIKEVVSKLSASSDPQVAVLTVPYGKLILKIVIANLIEEGKNTGTVLIAEDVTDYHTKVRELTLANDQLKKMQDKLIQEAKFSMLGQLSTTVTREIENPLVSALSYTTLLLRDKSIDDAVRYKLDVIQEEIQRVRSMIRDLIDFGREEEHELERVDAGEMLQRIVALIKHRAESSKVTIVEKYSKNLPLFFADTNKIKQVFINLINNAFEAMPHGGTLTITTSATSDKSFPAPEMINAVQIEIADTGIGISPEFLPQIFNPFFSSKPEKNTTGLGLSTSMKIIQDLGGTIEVDSQVGAGSVFTIKVPLSTEDMEK